MSTTMLKLIRRIGFAVAMVVVVFLSAAADGAEPELITIAGVRAFSPEAVAARPTVRIRGVVTGIPRHNNALFVQDETGGAYVHFRIAAERGLRSDAEVPADIRVGSDIEVIGQVAPGGFAPPVLAITVRHLGQAPLPQALQADPLWLFSGAHDCQRVSLEGRVQDVRALADGDRLAVGFFGRTVLVDLNEGLVGNDRSSWLNARVRLVGPAGAVFNTRGEILVPTVCINRGEDLVLLEPSPCAPFESPLVPLGGLGRFRPEPLGDRMVRVRGRVVHAEPGRAVYLQEGVTGIRVATRSDAHFTAGDLVEAAGFLDRSQGFVGLAYGLVRRLGHDEEIAPIDVSPADIDEVNRRFATKAIMAEPGDYDGCLIRFTADLVEIQRAASGGVLVLNSDGRAVTALFDDHMAAAMSRLRPGSRLGVTGITQINWQMDTDRWPPLLPTEIRVIVRSQADVTVVRSAPWWTPRRLATLAGVIGASMVTVLAWVWLLRRRLEQQRVLLAEEMHSRRNAAIEFDATLRERNRLAANLHDTLLQTLGGIGFQLDACEGSRRQDEAEARQHFDLARSMVKHATNELHQSVWAMRTLPLAGQPFREALPQLADRLAEGRSTRVQVIVAEDLPDLPRFVAGNLLLVAQEAITNALRHARASRVTVRATVDRSDQSVRLRIEDDGVGFEAGHARGPNQGHFGMLGMRERVAGLGGRLTVDSAPGRGTTVTATVHVRDYDDSLAGEK